MPQSMLGKLITFEGIEGVGKSSLIPHLAAFLNEQGIEIVLTREPGGTKLAEEIRHILLSEQHEIVHAKTELLLFYAARMQHVENVIKPALFQGKWVICDRFIDATFAYQGAGRGVDIKEIQSLNDWALNDFRPDVTVILDAPVEVAFARIKKYRQLDRFEKEKIDFFERIRGYYLHLTRSMPEKYQLIDASVSMDNVKASLLELAAKWV